MKRVSRVLIVPVLALAVILGACTASQLQTAESLLNVALQDAPAILNLLAGFGVLSASNLQVAQAAVGRATADYALAKTLIADFKAAPDAGTAAQIQAALADASTNLNSILTASEVKNAQSREKITGAVQLLVSLDNQISAIFPSGANAKAVRSANQVRLPSASEFQKQFNAIIGH